MEAHVQVEATWGIYQRIVTACAHPYRAAGKTALAAVTVALRHAVPPALSELVTLPRTLHRRAGDTPGLLRPPKHVQRTDRSHL